MASKSDGADDAYEVGYGKPPKGSQFKPGKSGNPKGRPKAPPKVEELIAREAARLITITVEGQKKTLTQAEVVIKAMFQKAMKGDLSAAKMVVFGLQNQPETPEAEAAISEHELRLLQELIEQTLAQSKGAEDPKESSP